MQPPIGLHVGRYQRNTLPMGRHIRLFWDDSLPFARPMGRPMVHYSRSMSHG